MVKTISISGLIGIVSSMLLKIIYGDLWAMWTVFMFMLVAVLISLKETLSFTAILWLAHILFAGIIGFIALLFTINPGLLFILNAALLRNILFFAIVTLALVTIGSFLKETYERL